MNDLFKQRLGLSSKLIWNIYIAKLYRPNRLIIRCDLRNKILFAGYVNSTCHLADHVLNSVSTDWVVQREIHQQN